VDHGHECLDDEAHYRALIDTAKDSLLDRLEAFGAHEGHAPEAAEG
jgi:hypothetical protein